MELPEPRGSRNIPAYAGKTFRCLIGVTSTAEHPRVCGENPQWMGAEYGTGGTSPRMRGKRILPHGGVAVNRNIPAYAGKTLAFELRRAFSQEHPRVCGENLRKRVGIGRCPGTSPRMRGKPATSHTHTKSDRNIPAYAGKTLAGIRSRSTAAEHPRVCGENSFTQQPEIFPKGTSPRMRGKPTEVARAAQSVRNIPAYAGKTTSDFRSTSAFPEHPRVCGENPGYGVFDGSDKRNIPAYAGKTSGKRLDKLGNKEHPRVCGENAGTKEYDSNMSGTSPRMRGKRRWCPRKGKALGNIPAYAGKTTTRQFRHHQAKEHPRVCGENLRLAYSVRVNGGTSPRMRGKLESKRFYSLRLRNIPAYAGKTDIDHDDALLRSEHPRVCGENSAASRRSPRKPGTSPRMRGKLGTRQTFGRVRRNIPAYAGKTPWCRHTRGRW